MKTFELLFTPGMLLMPILCLHFYRSRDEQRLDMQRVRALQFRLRLWTGVALCTYFVLYFLRLQGSMESWQALPWTFNLGVAAHKLIWLAFLPLWFGLAVPLLMACG